MTVTESSRKESVHVLIAEDSPTQAELLGHLLREHDYHVTVTADGRQALDAARRHRPTLIVSDIVMPEMDGYAFCKAVKADAQLRDVPVVIVTSLSGIQDIVMALDCGADNFIRKPYDPQALIARVQYILANRELRGDRGGRSSQMKLGLEIYLGGKKHFITSEREQILDLLVASYEQAVQVNEELKQRDQVISTLNADLERRAAELETANKELEAFSHSVSHDLRAPLMAIDGFTALLQRDSGERLDARGRSHLTRVRDSVHRMGQLIDDLLYLSKVTRTELQRESVDLAAMAEQIVAGLRSQNPGREVEFAVAGPIVASSDQRLIRIVMENLLGNAWKFTGKHDRARIEFAATPQGGEQVYSVRDNGAGFDMAHADSLFMPFHRLHTDRDFPGLGVGLATVQRIVHRHGGRLWAQATIDQGAALMFTLPDVLGGPPAAPVHA